MNFIKYILMFFIFAICTLIGNLYSKKYINRVNELEKINNILNVFKAKIKFTCLTIQEIFMQIYEDNQNNIGDIFKQTCFYMKDESAKRAWEMALEETKDRTNLNNQDIIALKTLGKMLGNTDLEGQVSQIELTQKLLSEQIENAKTEKNKNEKIYRTLGIVTGLTIVIILI